MRADMTYTAIGVLAVVTAVVADLLLFRTKLVTRRVFWVSYAIIVFFPTDNQRAFYGIPNREIQRRCHHWFNVSC